MAYTPDIEIEDSAAAEDVAAVDTRQADTHTGTKKKAPVELGLADIAIMNSLNPGELGFDLLANQHALVGTLSGYGLDAGTISRMTGIDLSTVKGIQLNPEDLTFVDDAGYHFSPELALFTADSDNAFGGYCAKGVGNILTAQGLEEGVDFLRGDGHDWANNLERTGWVKLAVSPEDAPPGAILVYNSDIRAGKPNRGTGGGSYGHAEIKVEHQGRTYYVSDKARDNYGGSVPDNYVGAYVRPEALLALEEHREIKDAELASVDPADHTFSTGTDEVSPDATGFNDPAKGITPAPDEIAKADPAPAPDRSPAPV